MRETFERAQGMECGQDRELARAESLARWLDGRYLDPLVGLFLPGVGDLTTAGFGLYLVLLAIRRRLPAVVIARMLLNLSLDAVLGGIPLLGDFFDFVYRANLKNLALLKARYQTRRYTAGDLAVVLGCVLLLLAALSVPVLLALYALRQLAG
jgi:hypothetical protein